MLQCLQPPFISSCLLISVSLSLTHSINDGVWVEVAWGLGGDDKDHDEDEARGSETQVDSRDSSSQSGSCKDGRQQHPRPAEQPDERWAAFFLFFTLLMTAVWATLQIYRIIINAEIVSGLSSADLIHNFEFVLTGRTDSGEEHVPLDLSRGRCQICHPSHEASSATGSSTVSLSLCVNFFSMWGHLRGWCHALTWC